MTKHEVNLRRAFDNVYDRFPYFASIVVQWKVAWTREVPYAATNGPSLFLNPDFMDTLTIAEATSLVLHELGHIFLGHQLRLPLLFGKGGRISKAEHQELNVAADLALNDVLSKHYDEVSDPDHPNQILQIALFPGRRHVNAGDKFLQWPVGKDAEFYLDLLKKSRPKQQEQPSAGGKGQPQEADGDDEGEGGSADGTGDENQESSDSKKSKGKGKQAKPEAEGEGDGKESEGSVSEGDEGSENGKIPNSPYEEGGAGRSDLPESFGDVLAHPAIEEGDEQDIEEATEKWESMVAQGINNARGQGNLPGWLEQLGNELYGQKSKQNWRAILRKFMTVAVNFGGLTYERPNRRHAHREDIIIPANRSRQASKGCVLVDTSGSMDAEQCNAALSEIEAMLRTFPRCTVDLIMADTRLIDRSKKTFHRYDFPMRLPMEWLGRGGTDLCDPILGVGDAARRKDGYKWLVVISDMYWSAQQAKDPKIPTIFVWTPDKGTKVPYQKAKFGTFIGPVESWK